MSVLSTSIYRIGAPGSREEKQVHSSGAAVSLSASERNDFNFFLSAKATFNLLASDVPQNSHCKNSESSAVVKTIRMHSFILLFKWVNRQ